MPGRHAGCHLCVSQGGVVGPCGVSGLRAGCHLCLSEGGRPLRCARAACWLSPVSVTGWSALEVCQSGVLAGCHLCVFQDWAALFRGPADDG